jgi:hypothetical protein
MARECDRRSAAGMGAGTQRRVADVTVKTARMPPEPTGARTQSTRTAPPGGPHERTWQRLSPLVDSPGRSGEIRPDATRSLDRTRRRSCAADTTTGET